MKTTNNYSDTAYVEGVYKHDPVMERALYKCCKQYFFNNYKALFFVNDEHKKEIFQNTFIKLWENIETRKIYVEDGVLKGKEGKAFTGTLTTYFMGIAKLKYKEWARQHIAVSEEEEARHRKEEMEQYRDMLYDSGHDAMMDIVADCLSRMSERCNQIITMYYYEEKGLDDIMARLNTFTSKQALKTAKYKCMENLRKSTLAIYNNYLNA